jgi:hypothetical protein
MNMVKTNKLVRRGGILVMATALAAGSWYGVSQIPQYEVPQLTSSIDEPVVVTGEDEVPLGNAKTTTKTTTKTTKKTVKLKKASTKTYKVTKPKTTKKTTKTSKNKKETVKVETTTVTSIVENYTKKSKNKVVTTSVKTTTKTTTTPVVKTVSSTTTKSASTSNSAKVETKAVEAPQTYTIEELAPKADQSVLNAYSTLKFDVTVDPSVSYAGYFDARGQSITLQIKDDTIYHELGHFLAFMAGNVDTKDNFVAIYNEEKENFTGINKAYATQNSSEYFAESYKDYILDPTSLQSSRPQTYESITQALSTITDSHVNRVQTVYSSVWKK